MEVQYGPPGSQFPGHASGEVSTGMYRRRVEPRVGLCTMSRPGAVSGLPVSTKIHGENPSDNGFSRHSKNTGQKRAFAGHARGRARVSLVVLGTKEDG